eukprot:symbB.v1.2.015041.t1/scaffold1037.1/size142759/13
MAHLVDRQVAGRVLLQPAPTVESRPRVSYSFHDLVKLEKSETVELHRQHSDGGLEASGRQVCQRSCSGERSNGRPGNGSWPRDYSPGRPSPSASYRPGSMATSAFNHWPKKTPPAWLTRTRPATSLIFFEKTNSTFHMKVGTSHYAFCVDQYGGLEHLHYGNWVGMHDFTFLSETDPALNFEPAPVFKLGGYTGDLKWVWMEGLKGLNSTCYGHGRSCGIQTLKSSVPSIGRAMHRQCAGVPNALKNALENGSISELLDDVKTTVRRVSGRLFFQEEEEVDEATVTSDEEGFFDDAQALRPEQEAHTASASSSHAPAGGLGLEADSRVPTWAKKTAEPMTKYMFLDEGGDKGVVKVYIKAEELELSAFSDVYATFQDQSFSLLVLSDGRVWRLQGRLFGPVRAEECSTSLSPTGHKVVVTLRKTDAKLKWNRLIESSTQQDLSKDFI